MLPIESEASGNTSGPWWSVPSLRCFEGALSISENMNLGSKNVAQYKIIHVRVQTIQDPLPFINSGYRIFIDFQSRLQYMSTGRLTYSITSSVFWKRTRIALEGARIRLRGVITPSTAGAGAGTSAGAIPI
ncbi:hypothetical protein N7539_000478 [Penicillium diatomitis]|uniref:Uncharacterized protein n=1 Tax=Penicillium diatomitis TaxID=2819901 RepID=A0A9W9XLR8_9EURO|nr:uncharacterized protein N7539_000478 [Penicillium diatomitis]KAJ5495362.1 hypothetical protein N7539_000478 [Penicillium diatomitis]